MYHDSDEIKTLNPNSIGVRYSLIVLGGGFFNHVSVFYPPAPNTIRVKQ